MSFARPSAVLATAALLLTGAAVPAAVAAGPVAVSEHVAAQPAYDVASSADGTVFVTTGGEVRLVRAPVAPGSPEVSLGTRGAFPGVHPGQEVSIVAGRVAIPELTTATGLATSVRWCLVDDCPTTSTLAVPAGWRYLGNAGDAAVVHRSTDNRVGLVAWTGGTVTSVVLAADFRPLGAYADATGIALWSPTHAAYVARPSMTVTVLAGHRAYLTPTTVAFLRTVVVDPAHDGYSVMRVPRATPGSAPVAEATLPAHPGDEPVRLVATDDAAAWTVPLLNQYDSDSHAPQVGSLYTVAAGGPVESGFVEWDAVAPLAGGPSFVVHRGRDDDRGFYAVVPGTTTATVVHRLPDIGATVGSISVSEDRVAFADDSAPGGAAYVRDVSGGTPGDETLVREMADHVALSAAFVAVNKNGPEVAGPGYDGVYAGRLGDRLYRRLGQGVPTLSGFRLLSQSPTSVERTRMDNVFERDYWRSNVVGTVFGNLYYVADRNGTVQQRDLVTGAVRTVRTGTCGGDCGADRSAWQLSAWGDQLVYALDLGAHGRVAALWDASTGVTTPLDALDAGWTRLTYRDGLLLVHRAGDGVRLHDLTDDASALVDATGDLPPGNGLGTSIVAWRSADGQAVARPIAELLPAYDATPVHLNAITHVGAGPNLPDHHDVFWPAELFVSDDGVPWELTIRSGSASGPVVRTMTGTSDNGTIDVEWDGDDDGGDPVPQGYYAWTIASPAGDRSGTLYVTLATPPTPTLNTPVLTSDASATDTFTITWDGAPDGYHYRLDGPAGTVVTTAESRTYTGRGPGTFRFALYVEDPGGRRSLPAEGVTVTPYDDARGTIAGSWPRVHDDRHWLGSQRRTTTAGSTFTFSMRGDGVWIVGPRGPAYGRYRVTVGSASYTYDAYSPTVKFRQVLFKLGGLSYDRRTVKVTALSTPGRTRLGIDAYGVRLPVDYWMR